MMRRTRPGLCAVAQFKRGKSRLDISGTVKEGTEHHGFKCIQVKDLPEMHFCGYEFVHQKTGAKYFHLDTDDQNNAFCIGFCTPAENSKGTTHVLEHTTLCGSHKYPVRDPFFHMLRRSLNTFMNAMTGADYTLYPFSTMNSVDYSNLLNVYLDSVFNPLLRPEDFAQEGHRLEVVKKLPLTEADGKPMTPLEESQLEREFGEAPKEPVTDPNVLSFYKKDGVSDGGGGGGGGAGSDEQQANLGIVYNGVVYNEMRGCISDPQRHFITRLEKNVLPKTHYEYVSGGYPTDILELTHEELVSYHQRHYHPSNSVTLTYGDLPPWEHMKLLDKHFSGYERSQFVTVPKLETENRFTEPKKLHEKGPVNVMGDPTLQKKCIVSYALPAAAETPEGVVKANVLEQLLASGPSSPMYKALIESQLGSSFAPFTGYADHLSTPLLSFGLDGLSEKDPDIDAKVVQRVLSTLEQCCNEPFDQRRVDSIVFQEELSHRHRSTGFGVNVAIGVATYCLVKPHLERPLDYLDWIPHLKKIQQDQTTLQQLLKDSVLDNKHRLDLTISADRDFLDGLNSKIKEQERVLTEEATREKMEGIITQSAKHKERLSEPQDSNVLPTLTIADISTEPFKEPEPIEVDTGVHIIPHDCNGLVYFHCIVPFEEGFASLGGSDDNAMSGGKVGSPILDVPLFHTLLGKTGIQGGMSYKDFDIEANLCSGGFSFGANLGNTMNIDEYVCGTSIGFMTTVEKLPRALELITQALLKPATSLDDADVANRVEAVIKSKAANKVSSVSMHGNSYAAARATSCFSTALLLNEAWTGLSQVGYLQSMLPALQSGEPKNVRNVTESVMKGHREFLSGFQQRLPSTVSWCTCDAANQDAVTQHLRSWYKTFGGSSSTKTVSDLHRLPHLVAVDPADTAGKQHRCDISRLAAPLRQLTSNLDKQVIELPIDTNFVGQALYHGLRFDDPEHLSLRLACQILKNEYLHRAVREEGGAYGAGATAHLSGDAGGIVMTSYRDPTPERTVDSFNKAGAWLSDASNITPQRMREAMLRLFASIDQPYSAAEYGTSYFTRRQTHEMRRKNRQLLLTRTEKDILEVAPKYFNDPLLKQTVCLKSGIRQ